MPNASESDSASQPASSPAPPIYCIKRGHPLPLGATVRRAGVNFSIFSKHATSCCLLLFESGTRNPLHRCRSTLTSIAPGRSGTSSSRASTAGAHYGYRFDMQPNPEPRIYRFNESQTLLDPYARVISGGEEWGAYMGAPGRSATASSAKTNSIGSTISRSTFRWSTASSTKCTCAASREHASSGVANPGTFAGLIEKIPYLKQLGVTAVELLPVNEFEESDTDRVNPFTGEQLLNLWGYQPTAFFAPNTAYSSNRADGEQVREVQANW